MAYCAHCGVQMGEGAQFCATCGRRADSANTGAPPQGGATFTRPPGGSSYNAYSDAGGSQSGAAPQYAENDETGSFDPEDIARNKSICAVSYLWILFFLPLVAAQESKFGRFHANQALLNFLLPIAGGVCAIIPILGWLAAAVAGVASVVFMIMGIVNAANGRAKKLPIIGNITIISRD